MKWYAITPSESIIVNFLNKLQYDSATFPRCDLPWRLEKKEIFTKWLKASVIMPQLQNYLKACHARFTDQYIVIWNLSRVIWSLFSYRSVHFLCNLDLDWLTSKRHLTFPFTFVLWIWRRRFARVPGSMVVVAWFNTLETWFGPGQFLYIQCLMLIFIW